MKGVNLDVFRFDYDLTFAALLMHPDGTIYHTYGGRDATDPSSHHSVASFVRTLEETRKEHEEHRAAPRKHRKRTVEQLRERVGHKEPDCYHCHMVHDYETAYLQQKRRWKRDLAWIYPDPIQAGLRPIFLGPVN